MWLAAARRFFTLLGAIVAAVFLCAVSIGLLLGASLNRSIAVGFEAFGCLLLLFALLRRQPRAGAHEGRGARRSSAPASCAGRRRRSISSTIAESAIFLVLGIVLILIGLAIDSRYRLV